MSVPAPMCRGCVHYRADESSCDAYPDGIPEPIMENLVDHRVPYAGDHGIRFEAVEPWADRRAVDVFGPMPALVAVGGNGYSAAATVVELGYSPGQKRDSVGRFGSGKGSAGSGAPSTSSDNGGPAVAGITPEGLKGTAAIAKGFVDEDGTRTDASGRLKAEAEKLIGADLDAAFPRDRLQALADKMPGAVGRGNTPGEQVADGMMATWAEVSYDRDAPGSVALQQAVAREFGTGTTTFIKEDMADAGFEERIMKSWDEPILRAGVRSMYNHTQAKLDRLGVGDTVGLVRGVGPGSAFRGTRSISLNPASSFTTDVNVANQFIPSRDGAMISMTVPRQRILSMPGTGLGCYGESEVVVMRGSGDRATGEAPP